MRRIMRQDDRGAVTLFVVLMMPLLLLFGALVLDGGRGVLARRQTQNAADAGALAKATDCAKGIITTDFTAYQTNGAVLDSSKPAPNCDGGETTVWMKRNINLAFAPGGGNRDVARKATAKWGSLGTATVAPIVISGCEFSQALLDGTTDITVYLDDAKPQSGCSSLPGGFSQLLDDDCAITVSAGGTVAGDPGGDVKKVVPCVTNPTAPALPHDVLIPMYDAAACQAAGCNGHGPYPILGFAMFRFTGYSFNGAASDGTLGKKCPDETRGKYCFRGDFIKFVTSQGSPGPGADFGVKSVYLSS
jgi:hypothetical protein